MCKILYLALWHFSPKWHDALSATCVNGGLLFQVQWCWASGQVTVRARFANSEKQHEWFVNCCHISIYGSFLSNFNIVFYFSFEIQSWWNTSLDFTYVSWFYQEIMRYSPAKSLFYKGKKKTLSILICLEKQLVVYREHVTLPFCFL